MFRFKLALALGKHIHEIDELPDSEIVRWSLYDTLYPIDLGQLLNVYTAQICAVFGNAHLKKGSKALGTEDFMFRFGELPKTKEQTLKEQLERLNMISAHFTK